MKEVFRFNRIRPVNLLFEEEKETVGIPLFPNSSDDSFALFYLDREKYFEAMIKSMQESQLFVYMPEQLSPVVQKLYLWLQKCSRPITLEKFQAFYNQTLKPIINQKPDFSLDKEWHKCSHSFLMKLFKKERNLIPEAQFDLVNKLYDVDYQLIVKTCKILDIFRIAPLNKNKENKTQLSNLFKTTENGGSNLIDNILELPILLPPGINTPLWPNNDGIEMPAHPLEENCNCDEEGNITQDSSSYTTTIRHDVADLYVIKEELARYEEGDIAYIENVLAGEERVRKHRSLKISETKSELETKSDVYEERDHQLSEKFSLQEQVNKTVQESLNLDAGVTVNSKLGPTADMTATANVGYKFSKSKNSSLARNYAKDIVDRSVSKIQENVRRLEFERVQKEVEEKNKHAIINETGKHKSGIYYWVNKITHAQMFNYGKRMMMDMYIPEPASLYKHLFEESKNNKIDEVKPPITPSITLQEIKRENFDDKLNTYNLTGAPLPPEEFKVISFSFQTANKTSEEPTNFSEKFKQQIPEDYYCNSLNYTISLIRESHATEIDNRDRMGLTISIGNNRSFVYRLDNDVSGPIIELVNNENGDLINLDNSLSNRNGIGKTIEVTDSINYGHQNGIEGTHDFSVSGYSTYSIALTCSVVMKCTLKKEVEKEWKLKIYDMIMDDYKERLEEYHDEKEATNELITIGGRNPFLNREIERTELKRHIIAILMNNYFKGLGSIISITEPCDYPEIDFEKMEKEAHIVRFFEQVIEWKYMNYLFYPSYWARKCKWVELLEEDTGDPLFDKFLTSGSARVQIPVRPGMEDKFNWFLRQREIWAETGEPPVFSDDEYVSMIQELKEAKQGDYQERKGNIIVTSDATVLELTDSTYYWDIVNDIIHPLNGKNDIDRELLIDFEIYRIVEIAQKNPDDIETWLLTIDREFQGSNTNVYKHSVGAIFVGAPWEVKIPTKLVYLQNEDDKLPVYN
ncbi:hypothetical protein [Zobellia roscoffensis]|uniref:hypothetical protein n=1 Tax=Zobellia roscoffensis TaxID=2779508 RepID=UPI001889CB78|nr:hypothetical protein [Zobellia roscoffensis]